MIIGNGIAGVTAARFIRKQSDDPITIISSETDHFFSRTALMYIYMGHMTYEHTKPYEDWFWEKNRLDLIRDHVVKIDTRKKRLVLKSGKKLEYDVLIIATGSLSNKFGWPGEDLKGVQGLYSYQDLENMEYYTRGIKRAVVVGGGLIGIEMTEMLLSRDIPVTFLVREESFFNVVLPVEESRMVSRHIREHGVDLRLETELKEILPGENGRVKGVKTKQGEVINCEFVGLTVGVHPNIEFLKDSEIETDKGVLVNDYFETNIEDVYAIGDCVQMKDPRPGRKAIEPVWYAGRIHGETVAQTITGRKTAFDPGPWFNSAKFFDIEYQVYGHVKNIEGVKEDHIYWEDENGKRSIRLTFDAENKSLVGVNLMGVRFKHKVCDGWISNGKSIPEVVRELDLAYFDSEFISDPIPQVVEQYNRKFPDDRIKIREKKGLLSLFNG